MRVDKRNTEAHHEAENTEARPKLLEHLTEAKEKCDGDLLDGYYTMDGLHYIYTAIDSIGMDEENEVCKATRRAPGGPCSCQNRWR